MDRDDALSRLPVARPAQVLHRLGETSRPPGAPRPPVRLVLASGAAVEGRLLAVGPVEGGRDGALLLAGAREDELVYVLIEDVRVVAVREFGPLLQALSFGAIARPIGEQAPSRLTLARAIQAIAAHLTGDCGVRLELEVAQGPELDEPAARATANDLFEALAAAVREVARDPMGQDALASLRRARLRHVAGGALALERRDQDLDLAIDLLAAPPQGLAGRLAEALNRAL